ncbi:MAG TPA: methionyl-tRNA formyltransferase [bacterium (Candidatus Stahlbacteria)]|nr:methionyl-tRNA formyltransferase [Candidatus Stahlbacteria bacterium]
MAKRFSFVFLSTDDFAIPTLDRLLERGECLALVTTPPRPRGRGKRIQPNPIDTHGRGLGLEIIYTAQSKDSELKVRLSELKPDFMITLSFPFIIPGDLLEIPRWALNLHPSILPQYRGPAPIRWAILNGEQKTGVTAIIMNEEIDAGMMVEISETEIRPDETYGELRSRLARIAPKVAVKAIEALIDGSAELKDQDEEKVTYAPKLARDMFEIDWERVGEEVVNLIRALSPKPGARTGYEGGMVKILSAGLSNLILPPGRIKVKAGSLYAGSKTRALEIRRLKPAGRREITSREFINGFHPDGKLFGKTGG